MNLTEETIWRSIKQKDVKAFEGYYKVHYKSFFLMACKYLKDSAQAEEIVNDVFMKIWQDGDKIIIETSLKAYIYKAVINKSLNALQKNKRESLYHTDLSLIPDESYELRQMEENELKIKLYTAIEQLPVHCKKVFEMSRFEELKQQEIADKLGISIKTVKNHITLALKHISKSVENYLLMLILMLQYFSPF